MGTKWGLSENNWVEYLALLLCLLAFLIVQIQWLFLGSGFFTYIIILLSGMIVGRVFYKLDPELRIRWFLISFGFLVGLMIGSMYGTPIGTLILFVAGAYISFNLHEAGVIKSTNY